MSTEMWRILKSMIIDPMRLSKSELACEVISLLPTFSFDEELLGFELTTEPLQNVEELLSIVTAVFTEFVTVPQTLALCESFAVTSINEMKMKIAGKPGR